MRDASRLLTFGMTLGASLWLMSPDLATAESGLRLRAASPEVPLLDPGRPPDLAKGSYPRIVAAGPDRAAVVWNAPDLKKPNSAVIYARWFNSALVALTGEFQVSTLPHNIDSADTTPAAARESNGVISVAWVLQGLIDPEDTDNRADIYARRFDQSSGVLKSDVLVNSVITDYQTAPRVLTAGGSRVLFQWDSYLIQSDSETVRYQVYEGGVPVGVEHTLPGTGKRFGGAGIGAPDGSFYLVWHEEADGVAAAYAARLGGDGELALPVLLSSTSARFPALTLVEDGDLVAVWRQEAEGEQPAGLYARKLTNTLEPVGAIIGIWTDVAPGEKRDKRPQLAGSPDGSLAVVAWEVGIRFEDSQDISAMLLDTAGQTIGQARVINARTERGQLGASVDFLSASRVGIAWSSFPAGRGTTIPLARVFDITDVPPVCGDANDNGTITASDAQAALGTAVGFGTCDKCLCDVDSSGKVGAGDALRILRRSVAIPGALSCPDC